MLAYEQFIYAAIAIIGTALTVLGFALLLRRESLRTRFAPAAQVAPVMITILGVLFGLTMAFIANDTWEARVKVNDAVVREADGLRALLVMADEQPPMLGLSISDAVHGYGRALVNEWPSLRKRQRDPKVDRAADRLLDAVASPEVARVAGPNLQALMLDKVMALRADHQLRANLAVSRLNPLKWFGMAFLGFVTLLVIAALHLEQPKTALAAMIFFAIAAGPEAAIVLIQGNPFQAPVAISSEPILQALYYF